MTEEQKSAGKPKSHTILWVAASIFVILSIAGLWAVDYYFSPEMINTTSLPEAVGK